MKSFCIYILIIAVAVPLLYADMAVHSEVLGPGQAPVPGVSDSLILVDVRVQDNHGNPVRRLRAGDFSLYQDGEEQAIISIFLKINICRFKRRSIISPTMLCSPMTGSGLRTPREADIYLKH
jgi:hypothetical protein